MRFEGVLFALLAFLPSLKAQDVQCVTMSDGCDAGGANEAALTSAIAKFQDGIVYGGGDIVLSSALNGNTLAMITYMCTDNFAPPKLEGSYIRSQFQKILACENSCGGVISPTNANCGFGALIANNGANIGCLSKAVNVSPQGSAPTIVPSVGAYKNPVCLFDSGSTRILTGGSQNDHSVTGMTVEKCIALARAAGARYAGVEFAGECYWGATQNNPETASQSDCQTPCSGNAAEVCGDTNRILIYDSGPIATSTTTSAPATPTVNPGLNGFTFYGCYSDDTNSRVLSNEFIDSSGGSTIEKCLAHAGSSYNWVGVEYGQECWYGDTLGSNSQAESSGCDMPCPGKKTELCGGGNRLQLYKNSNYSPPGAPDIGNFISQGCYTDSIDARALDHSSTDSAMTIEKCAKLGAGFKYIGVEYHTECYWGDKIATSSTPADSGDCNTACGGNASENCGGGNRISIYLNGDYQDANVNQGEDPWGFRGCYANNALENSQSSSDMTVDKCLGLAFSYRYAAIGDGNTCYWGDDLASGASTKDISECSSRCAGKAGEICGGPSRTIVYEDNTFEIIDVQEMIDLLLDLSDNEQQLLSGLTQWYDLVAQAQADAESGDQKRWLIPPAWVARLIPVWNEMRAAATVVNTLTRTLQRKATVWKRRATEAFQNILQQRPNVANEYQMIEFDQVNENAEAAEEAAGQIVLHGAEEAVALAPNPGALIVINVSGFAAIIEGLFKVVDWVQNNVQRYQPPPSGNPTDPNNPPTEPTLPPCPCGAGGCANPQVVLKRSALAYEESRKSKLTKRAAGSTYAINTCPGLSYTTLSYPSYGELVTIYNNQGLQAPHLDLNFFQVNGLPWPTTQCFWEMDEFLGAGTIYNPGAGFPAGYASEHTFENAFLRLFFETMVNEECVPCADATPAQVPGQPPPAPTPGLTELFFQPNGAANSRYGAAPATDFLVRALHWYHPVNNPNGWQEFFILENRINTNKRNILTPGNAIENTGTFGELLHDFIYDMARVEAGFEYLNQPAVAATFMAVFNRLLAEFTNFDNDPVTGQFPPNPTAPDCGAPINGVITPYPGWAGAFHYWVSNLLQNAETQMGAWASITLAHVRRKIDEDFPANGGFPLSNQNYWNWYRYGSAGGTTTGWLGCLAQNRFQFNHALYPGLF
ncbi:hypothetical protein TWF694_008255 [Orbilia ellipsospora]|uniref:WSC domain-containing protein n=1 Tax=Orbilia ellipsospora TaxID=2528407 RepID=A0AAV9XFM2_9PEZI